MSCDRGISGSLGIRSVILVRIIKMLLILAVYSFISWTQLNLLCCSRALILHVIGYVTLLMYIYEVLYIAPYVMSFNHFTIPCFKMSDVSFFKKPPFLDTPEKWHDAVVRCDTVRKFDDVMYWMLDDYDGLTVDYMICLRAFAHSVTEQHHRLDITENLSFVEDIARYLIVKFVKLRHECLHL